MPYKDKEKQKECAKRLYENTISVRFSKGDEAYKNLKEAAENKGISVPQYAILAIKEKLDRDGYI